MVVLLLVNIFQKITNTGQTTANIINSNKLRDMATRLNPLKGTPTSKKDSAEMITPKTA